MPRAHVQVGYEGDLTRRRKSTALCRLSTAPFTVLSKCSISVPEVESWSWSNHTTVPLVTMRETDDLMDRNRKYFVNAMVVLKLVRLVLYTILRDNGDNDEAAGDADNFLHAVLIVKLARLFFYGCLWVPLTVHLGELGSLPGRLPFKRLGRGSRDAINNDPLRGKQGFSPREVTDDSKSFAYNTYFHVLRLPLPLFLLCWFSTYAMVNVFFACLYYLDVDGLHVERKTDWPTWIEGIFTKHVTSWLTVLLYSSSILTNFSGAGADAHSPYTHMLGNAHAMLAQFVSLFWFSACFKRISKPVNVIRWSSMGVINFDKSAAAAAGLRFERRKSRILTIRFDIVRPYSTGLIDAKFDLICAKADCLQSPLQSGMQLSLVRKEAASVTHGALLQHVIDEKSPLYLLNVETLRRQDVILGVSVRAVDKSSMKQVFSEHLYSAYDNDILWDRAFQDQSFSDNSGRPVYDFTLLNKLRSPT